MREFVVLGHDAPTTDDFSLSDLPGAGRMDLLCRCLTSALLLSHDIRADVTAHLVLDDTFTVAFDSDSLRHFNPDERSTAARVRDALAQREEAVGRMPVETSPGVSLRRGGLEATLSAVDGPLYQLHGEGTSAVAVEPPANLVFVLSDHREFGEKEATLLSEVREERLSLGPAALHADQAITVAHNWLDTDGFSSY